MKITTIFLTLFIVSIIGCTDNNHITNPDPQCIQTGDVNNDMVIDILDLTSMIQYMIQKDTLARPILADVNGDDTLNTADLVYMIAWLNRAGPQPICKVINYIEIEKD